MSRKPRAASYSGYMHVITRGINKQRIFEDPRDYGYYLKRLSQYCMDTEVKICAYCLMNNHVHLLLKGEKDAIAVLMKKIGVSYSYYFNSKYNRVGHLFQDRYRSEPVDDGRYFFTVFRYILNNPQKAGICSASKYGWSSYWDYYNPPEYMDFSYVKKYIDNGERYRKFIGTENDDSCMEYDEKHDDTWAEEIVREYVPEDKNQKGLKSMDKNERFDVLKKIHGRGVTLRQIERLTGVSRTTIKKAIGDR